ncbi:phospholipase A [Halioxenophilus sp. WMMB6]|uniref:phospholipase A n=1 Tax=Halioxenophilus sp. WMMB6 TaxID=3073815 RepID=UPI00295E75CF|nr:phospholipase A [Halioxenophilus sp. WMMB6]
MADRRDYWGWFYPFILSVGICGQVGAEELTADALKAEDICLLEALKQASDEASVASVREACHLLSLPEKIEKAAASEEATVDETLVGDRPVDASLDEALSAAGRRRLLEEAAYQNRFALEPHRPNYFLPLVFLADVNDQPFINDYDDKLDRFEMQFQLSIKATLAKGVLFDHGTLYAAYTNRSYWQAYNADVSRPFRETNHEPEMWLAFGSPLHAFGWQNITNSLGVNHQSNGRGGEASRSWNRVIASSVWSKGNLAVGLRAWYRLSEDEKEYEGDPRGDDNPDIDDYLGYSDLQLAYTRDKHTVGLNIRNFVTGANRGSVELTWSFPMGKRFGGYFKYFNGYGESLIDYNVQTESVGIGFQLNDWL